MLPAFRRLLPRPRSLPPPTIRTPFLRRRRPFSTPSSLPPRPPLLQQQQPKPTLTARLKSLSKEYGYSALGVYLFLSALDFPFCFLAVRTIGTEVIGEWEEKLVGGVRGLARRVGVPVGEKGGEGGGWGVEEAREARESSASIWTELALAYAIHKSFIFLRVPLTAAVTPKVVRVLRGWGWDIGRKGKPKIGMPKRKGKE